MKKTPRSPLPGAALRLCLCTLLLAACAACSEAPKLVTPAPEPAATANAPALSLAQQLDAQIGDAACDNAQQCRTIAVGHKACGGPAGYRAWSAKQGDGTRLAQLAARQAAEQKTGNAAGGRMSTCAVVSDPGATCSAGRCVLNNAQ